MIVQRGGRRWEDARVCDSVMVNGCIIQLMTVMSLEQHVHCSIAGVEQSRGEAKDG